MWLDWIGWLLGIPFTSSFYTHTSSFYAQQQDQQAEFYRQYAKIDKEKLKDELNIFDGVTIDAEYRIIEDRPLLKKGEDENDA